MQFLEKLWRIWEKLETLSLQQPTQEEVIYMTKLLFFRNFISHKNEKNTYSHD